MRREWIQLYSKNAGIIPTLTLIIVNSRTDHNDNFQLIQFFMIQNLLYFHKNPSVHWSSSLDWAAYSEEGLAMVKYLQDQRLKGVGYSISGRLNGYTQ